MDYNENDFNNKDENVNGSDCQNTQENGENKAANDGTYSYNSGEKTVINPENGQGQNYNAYSGDNGGNYNNNGVHFYPSNPDYNRYTPNEPENKPNKPKKKKNGTVGVVCACVVICLVFSIAAFALGRYMSKDSGSDVGGTQGTGAVTGDSNAPKSDVTDSDVTLAYGNSQSPTEDTTTDDYGFPSANQVAAKTVAGKIVNSVVEIQTEQTVTNSYFGQYVQEGAGSGVIVSEDGFIATNFHVIENATKITVRLRSGDEYEATLWGYDIKNDLAVVKIEATGLSYATFGDSDRLVVGDDVLAVGNPLGELGGSVTRGIISALQREVSVESKNMTLLQTDTSVNPGNSGGGLFTYSGELIGIVNAKSSGTGIEGIAFAIPSNTARPIIQDIITNRTTTQKAYLGISIAYNSRYGVYVQEVTEGSDAEKAGMQANDVILYVGETRIASTSELSQLIASYYVGDTVSIVVLRGRSTITLEVTFTEQAQ